MRNMSFALTTPQFIRGDKDTTRRIGWGNLKPGEHFSAVEKAQGLRKGEKIKHIGQCICISNYPEPLNRIITSPVRHDQNLFRTRTEMEREGFPFLSASEFVTMFCKEMKCHPVTIINRITFEKVKE